MHRFIGIALFILYSAVSVGQDIIITNIESQKIIYQDLTHNVNITVKNDDVNPANATYVSLHLSTDSIFDNNDRHIGYISIKPLQGDESITKSSILSPIPLPVGDYFLIAVADYDQLVSESDETNNIMIVPGYRIELGDIDFQFNSFSIQPSIAVHDKLKLSYEIQNTGTTLVKNLITTFYLSLDTLLDSSDSLLNLQYNTLDTNGKFVSDTWADLTVPNVKPGNYYIIGKTDDNWNSQSSYRETNENNNEAYSPITITSSDIDLALSSRFNVSLASSYEKTLNLKYQIKNLGTTGVNGYEFDVFLSYDKILDPFDYRFHGLGSGEYIEPDLELNSYEAMPLSPNANYNGGNYYVFIRINPDSIIPERTLTNNVSMSYEKLQFSQNPIQITSANFPRNYDLMDSVISLDLTFHNKSSSSTLHENFLVTIYDEKYSILWSDTISDSFPIESRQTEIRNWVLQLDSPLKAAQYGISIKSEDGLIRYGLPLTINGLSVSLNGSIKGEDEELLTKGKLFLYQKRPDGTTKLIQKVDPVTTSDFDFIINEYEHTLYFIPDTLAFPNYIPTVFKKSTSITPSSFFKITEDTRVNFEILKVQPLENGTKKINGSVNEVISSPISRTNNFPLENLPVIISTESGTPVGITHTDASGQFTFENLPDGKYLVYISFELDQLQMEPVLVDLTRVHAKLDIQISTESITAYTEEVLLDQSISFDVLPEVAYGIEPFELVASSNALLAISFTSSDIGIAEIIDGKLVVHNVGTAVITASQNGNETYLPATSIAQTLQVNKAIQHIYFDVFGEIELGTAPITPLVSSSSELPVSLTSSNIEVAEIVAGKISILGAGSTMITATQNGNENYSPAEPISRELLVTVVTSLEDPLASLEVYPNPSKGLLFINGEIFAPRITITDMYGRSESIPMNDNTIDLRHYIPGIYLLTIQRGNAHKVVRIIRQ